MDLSEEEISKDYPNRIILTPQALENIQTDPFWKEPKILKALEASYGGSDHIITLEDLRRLAFKIVSHYVLNESGNGFDHIDDEVEH